MNKPKILLFDIETSPNLSYVWGRFEQDVIDVEKDWIIMAFAYKWYGDKETKVVSLKKLPGYKDAPWDDEQLVERLADVVRKADVVVTHNGDHFDIKKLRARMLVHRLEPLPPLSTFDTCKVARKNFGFDSNRLDELGRVLGLGRKKENGGFATWKGCLAGDSKSWAKLSEYCAADVELLESVYSTLRIWDRAHQNLNVITGDTHSCPICLSKNSMQKRGFSFTKTGKKQRYQCTKCGTWRLGAHEKIEGAVAT